MDYYYVLVDSQAEIWGSRIISDPSHPSPVMDYLIRGTTVRTDIILKFLRYFNTFFVFWLIIHFIYRDIGLEIMRLTRKCSFTMKNAGQEME